MKAGLSLLSFVTSKIPFFSATARLVVVWILIVTVFCKAHDSKTEEEEIHPWLYCNDWPAQPCLLGYYCGGQTGELAGSTCQKCPSSPEQCNDLGLDGGIGLDECLKFCNVGQAGDPCSDDAICAYGIAFCNYENEAEGSGVCESCETDLTDCLSEDFSERGQEDCLMSCDLKCFPIDFVSSSVVGKEMRSNPIQGAPGLTASAPLVDCTNLVYQDETECHGANDSICLIEDVTKDTYLYELVWKCEQNGGVGVMVYADYDGFGRDKPFTSHLGFKKVDIPAVSVSYNDGKHLRENEIGSEAIISIRNVGDYCWKDQSCSDTIPCIGQYAADWCAFEWGDGGWCWPCPVNENGDPNPYACFFDTGDNSLSRTQGAVEQCAEKCAASLKFASCKFCPDDLTGFEFGVEDESQRCYFCPQNDVKYPERELSFFGGGVTCWQMQGFFNRIDVDKDSENCRLAQMMNYICGCEGQGYGGANTKIKRAALVWLPRTMAFLSLLGSSFIVYDTSRSREKRKKVFSQLMTTLSIFDIFGSLGYLLTSLPMPSDDYMYGSHGNVATCKAQGFFIQLGTISCYMNVSLSVYYLLVIKMGWTESRAKKVRIWLFVCPIMVGLAFAFAGIPFYDNMILWCNNGAKWWPDFPVAIAISAATVVMGFVCWDVYKKEKTSSKWRKGNNSSGRISLATRVSWQSLWYLVAFYVTWIPYLALQYTWATGEAFSMYGFILFAGTTVPMQGAWNCFVYIRPRYLKGLTRQASFFLNSRTQSKQKSSSRLVGRESRPEMNQNEVIDQDKDINECQDNSDRLPDKNESPFVRVAATVDNRCISSGSGECVIEKIENLSTEASTGVDSSERLLEKKEELPTCVDHNKRLAYDSKIPPSTHRRVK